VNEPGFLTERRKRAADKALSVPLPDRARHRFRYTDPAALVPGGAVTQALLDAALPARIDVTLPRAAAEAGVIALPLAQALAADPGRVAEHLGRIAGPADPVVAVSLAAFRSAAVVIVPAGARVTEPIVVRQAADPGAPDALTATRLLVVAGRESEASVVEEVTAASGVVHATAEAHVGDGARLTLARTATVARGATAFSCGAAEVGSDATLTHLDLGVSSGLLKVETSPALDGRGGRVEGLGAALVGGRGRADFRVREDHAGTDTQSRVTWRAVASGKSQAVFTGLLRIRERAVRSEGYEEARALLLSRTARADVIPELEISNHDVRCSHGAAVGPVDEEARYYLMTRGMSAAEAEALLVEGFVAPVLARIPVPAEAEALLVEGFVAPVLARIPVPAVAEIVASRVAAGLAAMRGG